ncbi:MAG: ISL3 family transposase [Deltaproteobacteria bacterium]|nr:ISL3 family transposase [Deltaproteobacteria bacterium]
MTDSIHTEKHRCVRHLDIWGKKTFLHFLSRRFKCKNCGKIFKEQLPFVEEHRRQTKALELHVYKSCLSSNRKKVAKQIALSQSTVIDIFNCFAKTKVDHNRGLLTRVLGIDEISLKKRHKQFALVISDIDKKCILAVLPDRKKETLIEWLLGLTNQQRKAIKYTSIDMWKPYYQAVRKMLPHTKIVVDRFHVMKHLNERISKIRRKIQKNSEDEVVKTVLKGSRWLLVRNRTGLSSRDEKTLTEILNLCPELRTIYLLKEEFRLIFEKVDIREKAERFLSAWKLKALHTGNPFLARFVNTLVNWWQQILNYFFERITNGFVEGLNGAIRNIIRRAFGYRNFQNFKFHIFAEQGFHTNPR